MSNPLHDAVRKGDVTLTVKLIAEGANLNQKDHLRRCPIHLAAYSGNLDCMRALMAAGCDRHASAQASL